MMLGTFQNEMQMLKGQVERFKLSAEAVPVLKAEVHAMGVQLRHKVRRQGCLQRPVYGWMNDHVDCGAELFACLPNSGRFRGRL